MEIKSQNLLVLISPARTASTSLRMTLDTHPEVSMHGELFGPNKIHEASSKFDFDGPNKHKPGIYHRNIMTQKFSDIFFPNNQYLYGFNLLLEHWFLPNNFRFLDAFVRGNPKVIFLWRKNLLARARSELLFKFDHGIMGVDKLKTISSSVVEADCEKQILMMKRIKRELLSELDIDSITIYFEDLVSENSQSVLSGIQEFMGTEVKNLILSQDISRGKPDNRDKAITLIDELFSSCDLGDYENFFFDRI